MNKKSRINKITVSLTPRQAALNYVAGLQRFKSLPEYFGSLSSQWEKASPLEELSEQVKASVESVSPNSENKETDQAVRAAIRQVAFLSLLHHHVIALVAQEERLLVVLAELVAERLGRLIGSHALGAPTQPEYEFILKARSEGFVEAAKSLASCFYVLSAAVKSTEERYFGGGSLVFDSSQVLMQGVFERLDGAVDIYNNIVLPCSSKVAPIDLAALCEDARQHAERVSGHLVDMAKADTMTYLGAHVASRRIARGVAESLVAPAGGQL